MKFLNTGKFKSWNGFVELSYLSKNTHCLSTQEDSIKLHNYLASDAIKTLDGLTYHKGPFGQIAHEFLIKHRLALVTITDTLTGIGVTVVDEAD